MKPAFAPAVFRVDGVATAADTIGTLSSGCRVIGITKGQFSLLDLIRAVLDQTGPADVLISTWTTGIRDAENANFLIQQGRMKSFRMLTDRSFVTRQPQYVARVLEIFGADAIRCTKTHAKFAIIRNEAWDIAIRSSMNLNRNPRWEQFDLDDSADIADFFTSLYDEVAESTPAGLVIPSNKIDAVFQSAFASEDSAPVVVETVAKLSPLEQMRQRQAVTQARGRISRANDEIERMKRGKK
jgi:hypothetical protein